MTGYKAKVPERYIPAVFLAHIAAAAAAWLVLHCLGVLR